MPLGNDPGRFLTDLCGRPDLRGRRRLAVKLDQHPDLLFRTSLKTELTVNNADRQGAM